MDDPHAQAPEALFARRVSRWPVVVLVVGLSVALSLVILGADLAGRPVESPPIGTPGTVASPRVVTIIMRDYTFDPTPLYLYPNEAVWLNVFNAGMVDHELVLGDSAVQSAWAAANAGATPPAPFTTAPPASAPADTGGLRVLLASGGSTTVTYVVPEGGDLFLLCHLPDHQERGMVGRVVRVER